MLADLSRNAIAPSDAARDHEIRAAARDRATVDHRVRVDLAGHPIGALLRRADREPSARYTSRAIFSRFQNPK